MHAAARSCASRAATGMMSGLIAPLSLAAPPGPHLVAVDALHDRRGAMVGRARGEVLQLQEGTDLDLPVVARLADRFEGDALGPGDGLFPRLDLDDPVGGDQLPGLGEGTVDDNPLST